MSGAFIPLDISSNCSGHLLKLSEKKELKEKLAIQEEVVITMTEGFKS